MKQIVHILAVETLSISWASLVIISKIKLPAPSPSLSVAFAPSPLLSLRSRAAGGEVADVFVELKLYHSGGSGLIDDRLLPLLLEFLDRLDELLDPPKIVVDGVMPRVLTLQSQLNELQTGQGVCQRDLQLGTLQGL